MRLISSVSLYSDCRTVGLVGRRRGTLPAGRNGARIIEPHLKSRAAEHDARLARRLDTVIPLVMERAGLDAWVLIAREYAEDPVLATMLPSTWLRTARRRTILVFTEGGRTRAAIARYPVGTAFPSLWNPEVQPDQWAALIDYLDAADPSTIGIDTSTQFPLADGLTSTEHAALLGALPERLIDRVVDAESAAIGWLETRLPEEVDALEAACTVAHRFLRRALSPEVIDPGSTTTDDVAWWLRQSVHDAGLAVWFHPSVTIQRPGTDGAPIAGGLPPDDPIVRGDLVHIDFGIVQDGYHTDQQQHAYVLRDGETAAPGGLATAFTEANRLQDLLIAEFAVGRTGNELLAAARAVAIAKGIRPTIYTHPIGLHGHAAGATIGLWDQQDGVAGQGDYPIQPDTAWSIELSVEADVPEWNGRPTRIMLEEDAFYDGTAVRFLDGRQTELWLI
jgi:Xaa-Pro aminopeptidase